MPQNVSLALPGASAMYYNEYHQLYQAGVNYEEMNVFEFANLGLNFPEDGIYTMQQFRDNKADVYRRFVEASLEGWRLTFIEPERSLLSVMKRVDAARLASNPAHQHWMLKAMQELISYRVGQQGLGELSAEDFALGNRELLEQGFIKTPVEMKSFYRSAQDKRP